MLEASWRFTQEGFALFLTLWQHKNHTQTLIHMSLTWPTSIIRFPNLPKEASQDHATINTVHCTTNSCTPRRSGAENLEECSTPTARQTQYTVHSLFYTMQKMQQTVCWTNLTIPEEQILRAPHTDQKPRSGQHSTQTLQDRLQMPRHKQHWPPTTSSGHSKLRRNRQTNRRQTQEPRNPVD